MTYLWWALQFGGFSVLMARHAPVHIIMWLWFLMMCWEAYDLHPDHAITYSVVFGCAAYKAVHRKQKVRTSDGIRRS